MGCGGGRHLWLLGSEISRGRLVRIPRRRSDNSHQAQSDRLWPHGYRRFASDLLGRLRIERRLHDAVVSAGRHSGQSDRRGRLACPSRDIGGRRYHSRKAPCVFLKACAAVFSLQPRALPSAVFPAAHYGSRSGRCRCNKRGCSLGAVQGHPKPSPLQALGHERRTFMRPDCRWAYLSI
jgi:hypothetical protein